MKKSNIVFLTTIFPASKQYLTHFFSSLANQTYKNFDLLVVNDGVSNFDKIKEQYNYLNIIYYNVNSTPSKNREFGINKVIELKYDYIIFGDSDDYFKENRIEVVSDLLLEYDIVINDITNFSSNNIEYNFLSKILNKTAQPINIVDGNLLGFSNSAINTNLIKQNVQFKDNLIAVDWFFFSTLLLNNDYSIYFTDKTETFYRQHDKNTIGFFNSVTYERVKLGIKVKLQHYESIVEFCNQNKLYKDVNLYKMKFCEFKELIETIKSKDYLEKYIKIINTNFNKIFNGWWSEIITNKKLEEYENTINKTKASL